MDTSKLKKFAQFARRRLMEQVSAQLKRVLAQDSAARRESGEAVLKLEEQIKAHDQEWVIERVAYTWFNRFCALRFMDVNRYTRIGVGSPAEGQFQPEILAEAKMGHIDDETVPEKIRQQITALLARPDASALLPHIRCPTLLLCGRDDLWSPLARHEEMQRAIPGSRLEVIEMSGHLTTMEQPQAVSGALAHWLTAPARGTAG